MSEITESFEELKSEAKDLGLNIGSLRSKKEVKNAIDAHYASQSAGDLVEEVEEAEEDTELVEEIEEVIEEESEVIVNTAKKNTRKAVTAKVSKANEGSMPDYTGMTKMQAKKASKQWHARKKAEWMKKKVVTITNNDKRDNSVTTMAFLSAGVIQRQVPLDIPVELERCLIKVAQDITITNHVDEIVNGARTGNKIPIVVKKYGVSFQENEL